MKTIMMCFVPIGTVHQCESMLRPPLVVIFNNEATCRRSSYYLIEHNCKKFTVIQLTLFKNNNYNS